MPQEDNQSRSSRPGSRPRRPALALAVSLTLAVVSVYVLSGASAQAESTLRVNDTAAAALSSTPAALGGGFRDGRVRVDGGTLHYVIGGRGPAMVLLHGWPQTWWAWHDVMPALAKNFTVVAFDLPGLGHSSSFASGYDKVTTARRIHEAVGKLGLGPVTLVGHDMGALIAYPYARDYPSDVSRLVVMETPLSGFGLEDMYGLSFHFQLNMAPAPIPEQLVDLNDVPVYLGMIFDFSVNRAAIDRRVYYAAYELAADRRAGYEYYRAFPADAADNQAHAVDRRLTMPVLGMGGQMSFGPAVGASMQAVAADVRTAVVPNTAHFIPEENPSFTVACLRLFTGASTEPVTPELAGCAA